MCVNYISDIDEPHSSASIAYLSRDWEVVVRDLCEEKVMGYMTVCDVMLQIVQSETKLPIHRFKRSVYKSVNKQVSGFSDRFRDRFRDRFYHHEDDCMVMTMIGE